MTTDQHRDGVHRPDTGLSESDCGGIEEWAVEDEAETATPAVRRGEEGLVSEGGVPDRECLPPLPPLCPSLRLPYVIKGSDSSLSSLTGLLSPKLDVNRTQYGHLTDLDRLLRQIRKPYLSTSEPPPLHRRRPGAASGDDDTLKRWENTKYLSDRERDEIDVRAKMILRRCRERVTQLEHGEKGESLLPLHFPVFFFIPAKWKGNENGGPEGNGSFTERTTADPQPDKSASFRRTSCTSSSPRWRRRRTTAALSCLQHTAPVYSGR